MGVDLYITRPVYDLFIMCFLYLFEFWASDTV